MENENLGYSIKFKTKKFEVELKGDKDFVLKSYEKMLTDLEDFGFKKGKIEKYQDNERSENQKENPDQKYKFSDTKEIPLYIFFETYNVSNDSGLQKKFLASALYLIEEKNHQKFRTRDINELLKENNYKPFSSITIHASRLRDKKLLSIMGTEGNENFYTIYKGKIDSAKKFLLNSSE